MSSEHFTLIKPILHPKAYVDEDIKSYLQRIAELNHCGSFRWLVKADEDQNKRFPNKRFPSIEQLYTLLMENSHWTGFDVIKAFTREMSLLPANLKGNLPHLRYCPLCLQEENYYRTLWFLRFSTTCLHHQIVLKDRCPSNWQE